MKNYTIAIISSIILLLGVAVAYALLSTTLNVTVNTVTQSVQTWNIAFGATSYTATKLGGSDDTGRVCGAASVSGNNLTVAATTLSKPGDGCRYALTVKNTGTIAAILNTLTITAPTGNGAQSNCTAPTNGTTSSFTCGNITYKFTTDTTGNTALPVGTSGQSVAAGATATMYLIITYNPNTVQSSALTQTGAKFSFNYQQK